METTNTLESFKNELHGGLHDYSGDPWGTTMGAFFDTAEILYSRDADIPVEWKFRPGLSASEGPAEDWFSLADYASDTLIEIGNYLRTLTNELVKEGKDY